MYDTCGSTGVPRPDASERERDMKTCKTKRHVFTCTCPDDDYGALATCEVHGNKWRLVGGTIVAIHPDPMTGGVPDAQGVGGNAQPATEPPDDPARQSQTNVVNRQMMEEIRAWTQAAAEDVNTPERERVPSVDKLSDQCWIEGGSMDGALLVALKRLRAGLRVLPEGEYEDDYQTGYRHGWNDLARRLLGEGE